MLKNISKTIIMGAVFCSIPALSQALPVNLENVHIVNQSGYIVAGEVDYVASHYGVCSKDTYLIGHKGDWEASSRGLCPVTRVTVSVIDAAGNVLKDGVPFKAKASSSSEFKVVKTADGNVKVEKN